VNEIEQILIEVERVAVQAGEIALSSFGRISPEIKGDSSFVTAADRAVEEYIREQLGKLFPDDSVIGEEFAHDDKGTSGYSWIIDPIDGTTNYVYGLPHWAVCIARVTKDGIPDIGVVNLPVFGETYTGALGHGAAVNGRPLKVSAPVHPENEQLLAVWSSAFNQINLEFKGKVRIIGSTMVKFLYQANNCYIGALTPDVHAWDVAAGMPILSEAGGEIRLRDGRPFERLDIDPEHGFKVPPLVLSPPDTYDYVRAMFEVKRSETTPGVSGL
jgi:myo-inositol-1(or 4)-monophosphatase